MKQENIIKDFFINNELNISKLVDCYYNYISKIIDNFLNINLEDKEEIISDVFFIVWKNQNKLNKNLDFTPYIAGITKKVIYKKAKNIKEEIDIDEYENKIVSNLEIDKIAENNEFNNFLTKSLKHFGELENLIFTKFYYEDKKIKEIAKELKIPVSTVKTKLKRTRDKLKKILKEGGFKNE